MNGDFVIEGTTLKKYKGNDANVAVPESAAVIGDEAFAGCANLESIIISDSAAKIGEEVFCGCASLKNATIPTALR